MTQVNDSGSSNWIYPSSDKTRINPYTSIISEKTSVEELEEKIAQLEKRIRLLESFRLHTKSVTTSDLFMIKVCEVMKIPPERVARIVIDLEANELIRCYVQYIGGEEFFDLELPSELIIKTKEKEVGIF